VKARQKGIDKDVALDKVAVDEETVAPKEPIIKVRDVKKYYHMGEVTVRAVDGVTFDIYEGEFVVILGPSGSGKSTLLNIIGGMDKPTEGEIEFKEEIVTDYSDKQMTDYRRRKIGFVFQFYNLMANLSAIENVELATEICDDAMDIDLVMASVELADRADHFPAQMSGGEQQRVAIARAVAKNPDLLLCDEPTGALDFKTGLTILTLLLKVNKEFNKTIAVITHNAGIARMANRVIKMRSGKILENYINENPEPPESIEW